MQPEAQVVPWEVNPNQIWQVSRGTQGARYSCRSTASALPKVDEDIYEEARQRRVASSIASGSHGERVATRTKGARHEKAQVGVPMRAPRRPRVATDRATVRPSPAEPPPR